MNAVAYTIDQICEMTGVSRRTVRYYVQEGLLDPPVGRGRGGNYLESHVERLREIKLLQKKVLKDFDEIGVLNGRYGPYLTRDKKNYRIPKGIELEKLTKEDCIRIIENSEKTKKSSD